MPSPGKTRITLMLDDDVIEAFRAGTGSAGEFHALINKALRGALSGGHGPLTAKIVREIFREELARARPREAPG